VVRDVVGVAVGVFSGGQALNFGVPVETLRQLIARVSPRTRPLRSVSESRSTLMNVLISVTGLGGVALVVWVWFWLVGRRRAKQRGPGREVLASILKR